MAMPEELRCKRLFKETCMSEGITLKYFTDFFILQMPTCVLQLYVKNNGTMAEF